MNKTYKIANTFCFCILSSASGKLSFGCVEKNLQNYLNYLKHILPSDNKTLNTEYKLDILVLNL